jgi:hypothetical protein
LSQPDAHPHALSNVLTPALDGIVHALSDRGGQTEARREEKADQFRSLILSFQPRDVVEAELAGQAVLFHEVLADSARDVLRGMDGTLKLRAISGLISMGRMVQGNIDRLEKRGNRPYRTETASAEEEIRPNPVVNAPDAERPGRARPVAAASTKATPQPVATDPTPAPETSPAVEETSWLDAPFEQWLIETPADLARQAELIASEATPAVKDPDRRDGTGTQATEPPEPALPMQPEVYTPADMLMDAEAVAGD